MICLINRVHIRQSPSLTVNDVVLSIWLWAHVKHKINYKGLSTAFLIAVFYSEISSFAQDDTTSLIYSIASFLFILT